MINMDRVDKVHLHPGQGPYNNVNTIRNTQWSLNTWNEWRYKINKTKSDSDTDLIPSLAELPAGKIDDLLKKFVEDLKMPDGSEYPPDSIKNIIYGIQRHLRMDIPDISLFERHTKTYKGFQMAYSKKIKEITQKGAKSQTKRAQSVSIETEKKLWDIGAFHFYESVGLSNAIFYYTSKVFGLIAGEALRKMDMQHFKFDEDTLGKYVELNGDFVEAASCRHYKMWLDPPDGSIRQYKDPDNPRCYYNLLERYFQLIRRSQLNGSLFLKPTNNKTPTFSNQALGENNLSSKLSQIMKAYGIDGYYTNHSIILSVTMALGGKGINLKRLHGTSWSILDICKILDPPKGIIQETSVTQLAQLTPAIVTSKTAATAAGTIILQQQGGQLILQPIQPKSSVYQPAILQQMSLPLVTQSSMSQMVKNKVATCIRNKNDKPVKSRVQQIQPKIKQENQEEGSDPKADDKPIFPLYLSAADSTSNESQDQSNVGHDDPDDDDDDEPLGFIIKEEPIDDYDYFGNETSTSVMGENETEYENNNDTMSSETSNAISSTDNESKQETNAGYQRKRKLNETETNADEETDEPKTKTKISEPTNLVEVVLSFSKNSETGMLKQEVSVQDNYQEIFTSSSAYKTGRSVPDFDLSLGDFLPESCIIRPGDIQFKRIATSDGGKIVMNVRYSEEHKETKGD